MTTPTTIIDALKTYIATYSELKDGSILRVDHIGDRPTEYSIVPIPGARIIETYLDDTTIREYPFSFQSAESTADELERMNTNAFFEAFAAWLDTQTLSGSLPIMPSGMTAEKIEAVQWGFLSENGESKTAIYSIICKLTYEQQP